MAMSGYDTTHDDSLYYQLGIPEKAAELLDMRDEPLEWQKQGLSYTASGYGSKIPTSKVIYCFGKRHRMYACCFSNSASCYVLIKGNRYYI